MSRDQIQKAIDKLPEPTDFGVGVYNGRRLHAAEYESKFRADRETLLNSTGAFVKTCQWLEKIEKIKTINNKHSSYGLKHLAEEEIGYITNGVFIAAIHCGFEFKIHRNSPNVAFNMSEKSIKKVWYH